MWDEPTRRGWKLIISCSGERELYNLHSDIGELNSVAHLPAYKRHRSRLEAVLAVLAVCKGDSCRNPWAVSRMRARRGMRR